MQLEGARATEVSHTTEGGNSIVDASLVEGPGSTFVKSNQTDQRVREKSRSVQG